MTTEPAGPHWHSHGTAPTQYVTANGVRYAYRRFGTETGTPVVFLQHFRGGMDHWDPAVTEPFSSGRFVGLQDVDGFGELPGAPGAAA